MRRHRPELADSPWSMAVGLLISCVSVACSGQLTATDQSGDPAAVGPGATNTGVGGDGSIVGTPTTPGAGTSSGGVPGAIAGPGTVPPEVMGEQFSAPSLRRLTISQYQNSLRDL